MLHVAQITKEKTGEAGQCKHPISIYNIWEKKPNISLEGNYEEQARTAVDSTKHAVRTAGKKNSTLIIITKTDWVLEITEERFVSK